MMGFVWRPQAKICAQRGGDRQRGESRIMRSFKALHASHDKRIVGGGHDVWLVGGVLCVAAVNQE